MTGVVFAVNTIIVVMMCIVLFVMLLVILAFLYWLISESYKQKHGYSPRMEDWIKKIAQSIKSWVNFHLYNHVSDNVSHPSRHFRE
jgi:predicted PurR-regulated permease PerM